MRPPLHVLYVHHTSCLGGAEQSLVDMISSMDREVILPALALPGDGPLADCLFRIGVDVYFTPIVRFKRTRNPLKFVRNLAVLVRGVRGLMGAASAHRASVIHANSMSAALYAGPAARLTGLKSFLHLRDMIWLGVLGRILVGMFDRAIAVSQATADFYGLKDARVIPSGVNFDRFDENSSDLALRAAGSIGQDIPIVGMAGQLVSWKNHGDFIRAALRIRSVVGNVHFVIAGTDIFGDNPAYRDELIELSKSLGLSDAVTFLDWWDDMPAFYASLSVLVHPALGEPFGRVLVEAMGCGLPVVAYDCGGPSEVVRDGETGFLVSSGDWEGLADRTCRILQDESLRSELGKTAKKRARSRFGSDLTADRLMNLYGI